MFFRKQKEGKPEEIIKPQEQYSEEVFEIMPRIDEKKGDGDFERPQEMKGFFRKWWLLFVIILLVLVLAAVFLLLMKSVKKSGTEVPASAPVEIELPKEEKLVSEKSAQVNDETGNFIASLRVKTVGQEDISKLIIDKVNESVYSAFTFPEGSKIIAPVFRIDVPDDVAGKKYSFILAYKLNSKPTEESYSLAFGEGGAFNNIPQTTLSPEGLEFSVQMNDLRNLFIAVLGVLKEETPKTSEPAPLETFLPQTDIPFGTDTDGDGLTDREEELFDTDRLNKDTDGDNYKDGSEIKGGYNPRKAEGALLATSGLVNQYKNPLFGYSIYYPAKFIVRAIDETNREVIFTAATGELIQIIVNEESYTDIDEWFKQYFASVEDGGVSSVPQETKTLEVDGARGRWSLDGQTLYVINNGYLFTFTYNTAAADKINYPTAFERMIKDFEFEKQEVQPEG